MNGKRILIVDDDQDVRLLINFHLSGEGYEVLEASDGVEALEVLKYSSVDLVITDFNMPNMNGYELISALKKSQDKSDIPVILLTGKNDGVSIGTEGIEPDDILPKPFKKEQLLEKVNSILK